MEESVLLSQLGKTTERDSTVSSSRIDEPEAEPREALLAIIMCMCLLAMIGLVFVLVITASDFARGEPTIPGTDDLDVMEGTEFPRPTTRASKGTTTKRLMGGSPRVTAQQKFTRASTGNSPEATKRLAQVKELQVMGRRCLVTDPQEQQVFATERLDSSACIFLWFQALKALQGTDSTAKTVLAVGAYPAGSYGMANTFMADFARTFLHAANTYMADIIITIISSGWTSIRGSCFTAPPNVLRSPIPNVTDIAENWFVVSRETNYRKPELITGMGFEIATLQYLLEQKPTSLNGSLFSPCLWVKKVGVPAFERARALFNDFRDRTAWLLFNVQNENLYKECPEPPFSVISLFCQKALRSSRRTAQSRTVETEATATRAFLRCFPGVLRTARTLAASPFGTVCRRFGARVSKEIKRKKVGRAVAAAIESETRIAFAYFPILLLSARQCILTLMSHMENSTARSLHENWLGTT
ncbi:hypothetical protein HPB50_013640 [Hyalomma asiaticum]|uniref:Uncharacterized protein n=1 Tax=Hyalomma asiaticum TaxID=266040 RepID=A0ACB7RQR9_HYAAI|nr:hypothetical protein HPB50_013640 [Hyalomma asiaticum]